MERRRQHREHDPTERGLRDLVGGGRSQLGVSGALRGRDVNRPTDEDLAEAERTVVLVRRHWTPRRHRLRNASRSADSSTVVIVAGDHDDPGGADADPGERYAAAADVRAALDAIPTAGPTLTRSGRPASRS